MNILGTESTCDETGASVVKDGRRILSNVVASSVDLQKKYGGVVPEVAARDQVRVIIPVIQEALTQAFGSIRTNNSHELASKIDAIAVAHGPGLIGSLLIGVETAKALAIAWDKPLIPVNHLVGHVYANWLTRDVNRRSLMVNRNEEKKYESDERLTMNHKPSFPLVGLIVSGGHTDLVLMTDHGKFILLGSTLDDAAGEAFDKVAKLLGLGYPGGPEIERLAKSHQQSEVSFKLPRPMINQRDFSAKGGPAYGWDFSFSGLKTAVVNLVATYHLQGVTSRHSGPLRERSEASLTRIDSGVVPQSGTPQNDKEGGDDLKAHIAFEFQQAVIDVLVKKTSRAAVEHGAKTIVVGGGVAANELLRRELRVKSLELKIPVSFPQKNLSVDNGAMIAAAAFFNFKKIDPLKLSADPSLHF